MTEYRDMVREYHKSISLLQNRINEINGQIRAHKGGDGEDSPGILVDRRYKLYQEIWELQGDIRMMNEYIEAVEEREAKYAPAIA